MNFVSSFVSLFGLGLFLDSIEHDFIMALNLRLVRNDKFFAETLQTLTISILCKMSEMARFVLRMKPPTNLMQTRENTTVPHQNLLQKTEARYSCNMYKW